MRTALLVLVLAGCVVDADGDGIPYGDDCDDDNATIGAPLDDEACNGLDDDCDGEVPGPHPMAPGEWYYSHSEADTDGDGVLDCDDDTPEGDGA